MKTTNGHSNQSDEEKLGGVSAQMPSPTDTLPGPRICPDGSRLCTELRSVLASVGAASVALSRNCKIVHNKNLKPHAYTTIFETERLATLQAQNFLINFCPGSPVALYADCMSAIQPLARPSATFNTILQVEQICRNLQEFHTFSISWVYGPFWNLWQRTG